MSNPAQPPATPSAPPSPPKGSGAALEKARRDKLDKLKTLGVDPWGRRFDGALAIADVRARGEALDKAADDGPTRRVHPIVSRLT